MWNAEQILCRRPAVARADGLSDADNRSHCKPDDHHREHMHHLRADGNGGRAGDALELTDNEQVSHSIERLQKIRKQLGQRKQNSILEYAAGGEVLFHNPKLKSLLE